MRLTPTLLATTAAILHFAVIGHAQNLLTDDFTVTQSVALDPNFEIENRQAGSLAPSYYNISNQGSNFGVQLGNITNVGQPPGDGNYLLLADESGVQNQMLINAALTDNKPLNFTFDLYVASQFGNDSVWNSFSLRFGGNSFVVAGANEFGMLRRVNGGMQFFTNSASVGELAAGLALDSLMSITFSDLAGTGSAFAGNGSRVVVSNGGVVVFEYTFDVNNQLASDGLQFGFYTMGGAVGGVDNLTVAAVPEPTVVALICATGMIFGISAYRRRHQKS
jgi:hypothetical protein